MIHINIDPIASTFEDAEDYSLPISYLGQAEIKEVDHRVSMNEVHPEG
jgi:hypothetical protein